MKKSLSKVEKERYRKWLEHTANYNSLAERDISLESTLLPVLQDPKRLPSESMKESIEDRLQDSARVTEERISIKFSYSRLLAQRYQPGAGGYDCNDGFKSELQGEYDLMYIIPIVSVEVLKIKAAY